MNWMRHWVFHANLMVCNVKQVGHDEKVEDDPNNQRLYSISNAYHQYRDCLCIDDRAHREQMMADPFKMQNIKIIQELAHQEIQVVTA